MCVCVCAAPWFALIYSPFIPLSCYCVWIFLLVLRSACFSSHFICLLHSFFFSLPIPSSSILSFFSYFIFHLHCSFYLVILCDFFFFFGVETGLFVCFLLFNLSFSFFFLFYSMFLLCCSSGVKIGSFFSYLFYSTFVLLI